jgi:hypothetical protein
MGDFLQSIAGVLGGGSGQGPTVVPPMAGEEYINPGMKMFGITPDMLAGPGGVAGPMQGGIGEAGAIPGNQQQTPDAVVQGFKPKRLNFWQALGDQLLQHWGNKPIFEQRNRDRNLEKAMEGFTKDPVESIQRISKFDPDLAWKLLNSVQDNQRADAVLQRQNRKLDMESDSYMYQQVAGMMGAARPDTWKQMRDLAIKRGAARGVDVSTLIPENYDADSIDYIRYGAVKPKDQMTLEEQNRHNKTTEGISAAKGAETVRYHNERLQDFDQQEAGRNARSNKTRAGAKGQPKVIMTPGGNQLTIHPNGLVARMMRPDGTTIDLVKFGNGWKVRPPKAK